MHKITLLYAKNLITRKAAAVRQELSFLLLVENLAFVKRVDVVWTGEEGPWRTLPAHYHSTIDEHQEYWLARMAFTLGPDESLPGNVQFAVRYQTSGVECWDNNHGENYSIQADSGILVDQQHPVLNVEFESNLTDGQSIVPVAVAVDSSLHVKRVTVHWTSDEWKTTHKTHCRFRRNYWDSEFLSNARNPNHYGRQIWQATLKVDDAFRVRYKISCETRQRVLWDDNFGNSHAIQRRPAKGSGPEPALLPGRQSGLQTVADCRGDQRP
jgi:maltose 6'-phosphate phosphatase